MFKKKRKKLYNILKQIIENKNFELNKFKLLHAKNGQKIIEIDNGEFIVRLNSLYNPESEAERWSQKFDFKNLDAPLLMFGIANGIFTRKMLKKLGKYSMAILVEPDVALFIFCLINFDMKDILSDSRVYLFIDSINLKMFSEFLENNIDNRVLNIQIVCSHPGIDKIYSKKAIQFNKDIQERFNKCDSDLLTNSVFADSEMKNTLDNLHFIKNSNYVEDFIQKIPEDVPFFIIAAGPSLDKNVDELKKAEGKAFMLALDTSVRTLLAHNIKFDAIITVDAEKPVKYLSSDLCLNYPLFSGITANNKILELNKNRKILMLNTSNFLVSLYAKYNKKMEFYDLGGSVATAAFSVARTLGAKRIILVGQDLAYNGNATHAGNVNDNAINNKETEFVEGIDGKMIKTRVDWLYYLKWFKNTIMVLNNDIEIIDATEGGAKIDGTVLMRLCDAIDKYCNKEYNFKDVIKNLLPTFNGAEYLEVRQDLLHMQNEMVVIEDCLRKGIEACDKIVKISSRNNRNYIKEKEYANLIHNLNQVIEEQLVYTIISDYMKKDTNLAMRTVNSISGNEYEDFKYTCKLTKFIYKKIKDSIGIIKPKLDESLKKI